MKPLKIFLFWLAVLSPVLPLVLYLQGNVYDLESFLHPFTLGIIFGIPSYVYFQIVLLISARIRWIDRIFAHDKVMKFHGILALVAFGLGVLHGHFKEIYGDSSAQILMGELGLDIMQVVIIVTLIVMVPGFPHRIKILARFRDLVTKKWGLDYSILKALHNFTVLGIQLMAFHVILASSTQEDWLRVVIMAGLAVVTTVLWVSHIIVRPIRLRRNPSQVLDVTNPAPGHTEVLLKKPRGFRAKSGQFVFGRFPGSDAQWGEHPYTLSSGTQDEALMVTAKHLGNFSASMAQLKPGDRALVDGPYGKFYPASADKNPRPLVCIAGGIGITPFLSMLKSWSAEDPRPVVLFWAVRDSAELVHRDFFQKRAEELPNFRLVTIVENKPQDGELKGFLDQEKLDSVLGEEGFSLAESEVFFCGPAGMQKAVFPLLKKSGVRRSRLHYEQFSFG
ncbi:MAG: hypothetical protein D6B26_05285 [Spirochaetaceae bacterium]|nr:MAG: hypothetical protein D6B26_05285 [Spirochaetaceae bacterium]